MNKIILVGATSAWESFARPILEEKGEVFSFTNEEEFLQSTLAGQLTKNDLMVLSPPRDQMPSADLARLFRQLGSVRVLIIDGRFDYARLGDAMRGCAVGYDAQPWNRETLSQLVEICVRSEPPHWSAIDRRFGLWRVAI